MKQYLPYVFVAFLIWFVVKDPTGAAATAKSIAGMVTVPAGGGVSTFLSTLAGGG